MQGTVACRLETDTKIRLRFVVGQIEDAESQSVLQEEQQAHQDFQVLSVKETYENLVLKVKLGHACLHVSSFMQISS